jgi:RND family efflux transporter MFP subunit
MHNSATPQPTQTHRSVAVRLWLRRLVPFLVLVGAVAIGYVLIKTPPRAQSKPAQRQATLVEVQPVEFKTQPVRIEAMGTIQPAQTIELMPRVGGEVHWVSPDFVPGGTFRKDAKLVQIDPVDYELAKRAAEKTVTEARTQLRIEEGAQTVAREDFELLGEVVGAEDRDLVLRKPQLEIAEATLGAAEAELERAQIDLSRATVRAPFNAIVQGRPVNVGARVTATTSLAVLIGTDHYWVEATVPVGEIKWITFPGPDSTEGSTVRIYDDAAWGVDEFRTGTVKRLAASLEEQGRMAQIIIEVEDPLSLEESGKPQLLIGSFVRVEFEGRELENVAHLPRSLVHEDDRVWVFADDGTLDIREVEVAVRGRDYVVVTSGLNPGERLVTTDLSAPVQGMALRIEEAEPSS